LQKQPARFGSLNASGASVEQLRTDLLFELLHLPGQWGLGDIQARGGSTDCALLGHSDKALQ
jgi:hypothetical protein